LPALQVLRSFRQPLADEYSAERSAPDITAPSSKKSFAAAHRLQVLALESALMLHYFPSSAITVILKHFVFGDFTAVATVCL
jgi:hypothetical protein